MASLIKVASADSEDVDDPKCDCYNVASWSRSFTTWKDGNPCTTTCTTPAHEICVGDPSCAKGSPGEDCNEVC